MLTYLLARLGQSVFVIIGVTMVTYALVLLAGDPVYMYADERASVAEVEQLRRELGFDRPWIIQYGSFVWGLMQGDFGTSLRYHAPVFDLIRERLPATLRLATAALVISLMVPIPLQSSLQSTAVNGLTASRWDLHSWANRCRTSGLASFSSCFLVFTCDGSRSQGPEPFGISSYPRSP